MRGFANHNIFCNVFIEYLIQYSNKNMSSVLKIWSQIDLKISWIKLILDYLENNGFNYGRQDIFRRFPACIDLIVGSDDTASHCQPNDGLRYDFGSAVVHIRSSNTSDSFTNIFIKHKSCPTVGKFDLKIRPTLASDRRIRSEVIVSSFVLSFV